MKIKGKIKRLKMKVFEKLNEENKIKRWRK